MKELSYGVLASGKLGFVCLEQLINTKGINFVFTDKLSEEIISLCLKHSVPVYVGSPRNGNATSFINKINVDVLFSINYLFIVEKDILKTPKKYSINFHGSMLPKYRGRTPHVWAIINNEKQTGITAHLMTEKCDEGDIVYQELIPISENSTGASLLNEFYLKYPQIIAKVIKLIENDSLEFEKQDNTKATYFEKRTPDDGEIDWNWQKERICNWVRALTKPYPGAFTFYNNEKIIINKIKFSDIGFHQNDVNGKILECGENIIVKTSNGAIVLSDLETNEHVKFKVGGEFKCKILR